MLFIISESVCLIHSDCMVIVNVFIVTFAVIFTVIITNAEKSFEYILGFMEWFI